MKNFVYPKTERTGLGNMLFCWARAEVFARAHDLPILAPQWAKFNRLGPWARREKDKRYYINLFSNTGYVTGCSRWWILLTKRRLPESGFLQNNQFASAKGGGTVVFEFTGMEDFFAPFLSSQVYIRERLYAIVHPKITASVEASVSTPFMGVHIRRGDFKRNGHAIPLEWYARAIDFAKSNIKIDGVDVKELPVRVFTDDVPGAMEFFKAQITNLEVMPNTSALQDLLSLSKASLVIGTSRSTFSMWAVFLGQMPSVWHPSDIPPRMLVKENEVPYIYDGCNGRQ